MDWRNMMRAVDLMRLRQNWQDQLPRKGTGQEEDYKPVVKLFGGAITILLTECDEDGLAFGISDLGMGEAEIGYVSLDEIAAVKIGGIFPLEQDLYFQPDKTLSQYAAAARVSGTLQT